VSDNTRTVLQKLCSILFIDGFDDFEVGRGAHGRVLVEEALLGGDAVHVLL